MTEPKGPAEIFVNPVQYAAIEVYWEWPGANWRRLKREVNKATRRARRRPAP